jgi:hypothetical protein
MQTGRLSRIVLREDAQHGRGVKLAAQDFVWCHFLHGGEHPRPLRY